MLYSLIVRKRPLHLKYEKFNGYARKRSFRVVTWPDYKRKNICGIVEFKWSSIREHSFSSHSKDKFTRLLLILIKPLEVNNIHLDPNNLFYFCIFLSFFFFFSFFLCTHFSFLFLLYLHNNVVLIKN